MTDPKAARDFLLGEVEALEAFDFVAANPAGKPLNTVEVTCREDLGLEVRVPGRLPFLPALPAGVRRSLHELEFTSEDPADPTKAWVCSAADATAAVERVQRLLTEVFEEKADMAIDVTHGSHRAEHEAMQKLAAVRERVERVLTEMCEQRPEEDCDGDLCVPVNDVHVTIAPRVAPGGAVVVRVFAITNVGVNVVPELGLFLARLNFGLMFGRFALDAENHSIWVDETLLGDQFTDEDAALHRRRGGVDCRRVGRPPEADVRRRDPSAAAHEPRRSADALDQARPGRLSVATHRWRLRRRRLRDAAAPAARCACRRRPSR